MTDPFSFFDITSDQRTLVARMATMTPSETRVSIFQEARGRRVFAPANTSARPYAALCTLINWPF